MSFRSIATASAAYGTFGRSSCSQLHPTECDSSVLVSKSQVQSCTREAATDLLPVLSVQCCERQTSEGEAGACGCRECHPGTQSLQDPGPIHSEDAGNGGRTSQTPDANGPANGAMAFVIAVGSLPAAGGDGGGHGS